MNCFDTVQSRRVRMINAIQKGDSELVKSYVTEHRPGAIEFLPEALEVAVESKNYKMVTYVLNTCATQPVYGGLTHAIVMKHIYSTDCEYIMDRLLEFPLAKCETRTIVHAVYSKCFGLVRKLMSNPGVNLNDAFIDILGMKHLTLDEYQFIVSLFLQHDDVDPTHIIRMQSFVPGQFGVSVKLLLACSHFDIATHGADLVYMAIGLRDGVVLATLLANENVTPSYRCLELCANKHSELLTQLLDCPRTNPCSEDFAILSCKLHIDTLRCILMDYRVKHAISLGTVQKQIANATREGAFNTVRLYLQLFDGISLDRSIIRQFISARKFDLIQHIGIANIASDLHVELMVQAGLAGRWILFKELFAAGTRTTENQMIVITNLAIDQHYDDVLTMILPHCTDHDTIRKMLTFAVDFNKDDLVQLIAHRLDALDNFDVKRILDWACRRGYVDYVSALGADMRLTVDDLQDCFLWACISNKVQCVDALIVGGRINPAYNHNVALTMSIRRGLVAIVVRLMRDVRVVEEINHDVVAAIHSRGVPNEIRRIMSSDPRVAGTPVPTAPPLEGVDNSATIAFKLWNSMSYTDKQIMLPAEEILEEAITQDDLVPGEYVVINNDFIHIYALESVRKILNSAPFNPVDPYTRNKITKITRILCVPTPTAPLCNV